MYRIHPLGSMIMKTWEDEIRRHRKQGRDYYEAELQKRMKNGSAAERGIAYAAWRAWHDAEHDKLIPDFDENGERFATSSQAYLAACYAREDVAAVFHMQDQSLRLLHRLEKYALFLSAIAIYIAIKVT